MRRQQFNENFGGGAGAQPQLRAGLNIIQSLGGDGTFEGILVGHGGDLTQTLSPGQGQPRSILAAGQGC
jgi:hypothetical protein